jgi:ubiquinone/menaquinone biosynthesis C-methylase UbiE
MPAMSRLEAAFCASAPWGAIAQRAILPWALGDADLRGSAIEVGAGGGAMAAQLLARFPALSLTATDLDPAMATQARERLGPFGERATVTEADATALPFADGVFDAALSFLMLHHVGRWELALAELARVVRPGGTVFVYDLLDARANRLLHRVSRSEVRLAGETEVREALAGLPLADVRWSRPAGLLFRARGRRVAA